MQDETKRRKNFAKFHGHFRIQRKTSRKFQKRNGKTANGEKAKSQARKGIRRMPRRSEARKDAASCEKPWGAAGRQ